MSASVINACRTATQALFVVGVAWIGCAATFGALNRSEDLPEPLRARFEAGVAAEKAGRLEEAERDFQWVLRNGGKAAFVHNNLGIVYQRRRDHARAIAEFREAISTEPDYAAPHALLGGSLLAIGKVPEATRELERAVALDPKQPLIRVELAKAYSRANNLAGATDQYRALRDLAPQEPEYIYQAGQAYLKLAQWCLEQMKRIDPQSPRIAESRAEVYRAQGLTVEAIQAYEKAAQEDPRLPGIHLALAQIYLQQNKLEDARQEAERELAIVPDSLAAKAVLERINSAQAAR